MVSSHNCQSRTPTGVFLVGLHGSPAHTSACYRLPAQPSLPSIFPSASYSFLPATLASTPLSCKADLPRVTSTSTQPVLSLISSLDTSLLTPCLVGTSSSAAPLYLSTPSPPACWIAHVPLPVLPHQPQLRPLEPPSAITEHSHRRPRVLRGRSQAWEQILREMR